jgi:curved DNA-binding protein
MTDPYSVLGVAPDATEEQIKLAFRKLAMQHHPDKNPDDPTAEDRFKEINSAYESIKTPGKRAEHDGQTYGRSQGHPGGFEFGFNGFNAQTMEDIMREFARQHNQPRNRHFNTNCAVGFMDAYRGCEANLKMPDGREIRLKIPAGVDNGTRIRVQGGGENIHANQPPGDLYVTIQVIPHAKFGRDGKHLFSVAEITAIDAMLGTTLKIMNLDGEEIEIPLQAGIQDGHTIRLAGQGMPIIGTTGRGDMMVNIDVTVPTSLSEKQIELLKEIKSLSI